MDWRYNTIWFEQIDREKILTWDFKQNKLPLLDIRSAEYIILWYFKHKGVSFDLLPSSHKLLYLELNWANIKDFGSIGKFSGLKRLETHYCTKIENDAGISVLANTLENLHINQSKKLQSVDKISKLGNLKVLRLNNCGPLQSIGFLKDLPKLIDFRFVDTNILDGDLTPIIEHPSLRSVGFFNKRHYNYNSDKIDLILKSKSNEDYKDFVHKEQYETFKYK